MKKTKNHHVATLRGEFLAAKSKAESLDKTAETAKIQVRSAKRHFKDARKAFKEAKKASRKAAKLARRAEKDLMACMEKVATGSKRNGSHAQTSVAAKPKSAPPAPKRRPVRASNRKQLTPSTHQIATLHPELETPAGHASTSAGALVSASH